MNLRKIYWLFLLSSFYFFSCSIKPIKSANSQQISRAPTNYSNFVLINGEKYKLIPEVLSLRSGDLLSEDIYQKYDSRLVGASMVARFHSLNESNLNDPFPETDFLQETLIQRAFNSKYIDSFIEKGFLNQYKIGTSNGAYNPKLRQEVEDIMADIKLGDVDKAEKPSTNVRPIYAFLMFKNNNNGEKKMFSTSQYGDLIATMKDEVKLRSTFTTTDSVVLQVMKGNKSLFQSVHTFFVRQPTKISKLNLDPKFYYWEAQIWGRTGLSDVEYFLVNCPNLNPITEDSLTKLKKAGVPIYKCKFSDDMSHYAKTEQVYFGDDLKSSSLIVPVNGSHMEKMKLD